MNFGALNFGSEKCFCLGACCEKLCCEKPCSDEDPLDDIRAFEKCGMCPQKPDMAVREGSGLRVLA